MSLGCEMLALGTVATALGIAGSAVTTGGAIYSQGKLDSAEMSTMENWTTAVYAAADDLHLKVKHPPADGPATLPSATLVHFILEDEKGATMSVTVERRAQTLLRSRVDVGLFGSEPTARLLLSRIRFHAGVPISDGSVRPDK